MSSFRNNNRGSAQSLTGTPTLSSAVDDWRDDSYHDSERSASPDKKLLSLHSGVAQFRLPALPTLGSRDAAPPAPAARSPIAAQQDSNWRDQQPAQDWLAQEAQFGARTNSPSAAAPAPPPSKPGRLGTDAAPVSKRPSFGGKSPSSVGFSNSSNALGASAQAALAAKFPYFTSSEIGAFQQQYAQVDKDNRNLVHPSDLSNVATKAGASFQDVTQKLSQLNLGDDQGLISFEGFLQAVSKVREDKGGPKLASGGEQKKIVLHGHGENTTHTINEDEKESFTMHINQALVGDLHLKDRLPIDPASMDIFTECKDGLILAKLINDSIPGTIDDRVLNVGKRINPFQMTENNNVVVNSAKAVGCSIVNIGSQDLIEGREHLILGLIWQIIKIGLQAKIDIKIHPELFRLLEAGENLEDFLKLPPEQILLRWFNYHLKKAGWDRKVTNFSNDVKNGENYTVLLNQLAPDQCSRAPLKGQDLFERAEKILQNAEKLGCRKYLTPKTLVGGNSKLNFAFVAHLFNTHPGLEKLSEAEMAQLDEWLFSSEGDREARAFALWLNSFGVEPFVNNLFDDLRDGLVLLHAIDTVHPGTVDWKKVNRAPVSSRVKKVENCNLVVDLGKSMKFSLVGIGGVDVTDGKKTLTLALVWQLMREHVIQTLRSLTSSTGREITDADMIKIRDSVQVSFSSTSYRGSKKGVVNYELVSPGKSGNDAKMNAKYAISIARKLGATIFVLPEDIVEVKAKMILTFVGTLMALDKSQTA
ncbi:hypothetical protein HKX48_007375 [Thoreauomyces humboldtii]|nr:hypothetical protein HKX48_007375 [Thoreauomyces humboldtii]